MWSPLGSLKITDSSNVYWFSIRKMQEVRMISLETFFKKCKCIHECTTNVQHEFKQQIL